MQFSLGRRRFCNNPKKSHCSSATTAGCLNSDGQCVINNFSLGRREFYCDYNFRGFQFGEDAMRHVGKTRTLSSSLNGKLYGNYLFIRELP